MAEMFPTLPEVEVTTGRRPRVCIATWEIEGPTRNGGIGTAYTSLADALQRAGQEVTVLYLQGSVCNDGNIVDWAEHYRTRKGINLVQLPLPHNPRIHASWASSVSYHAYNWLKEHQSDFDVVHFPECQGIAFYSLLAKRQGLAFRNVTFVVSTHGPTFWVKEGNQDFLRNIGELEIDYMERLSVAAADIVTSPSRYLLDWVQSNGWQLPEQTYIAPYVLPEGILDQERPSRADGQDIREVVFFGRLEIRKGLKVFCDALDELSVNPGERPFEVTFLGKETEIYGRSSIAYISDRSRRWSLPWHVVSNKNQRGAIEYLRQPGRLAVISSLGDNFPNTVLECIGARIPFLASNIGGIPEIMSPEDKEKVCFEPRAEIMAERIRAALKSGGPTARPSDAFEDIERKWVRWHTSLAATPRNLSPRRSRNGARTESIFPLVSVCFAYSGNENTIASTLESLQQQDYPHLELILTQCGANNPASNQGHAKNLKFETVKRVARPSWDIGAARNAASREAQGEYLFFIDDHTLLLNPSALSIFVQVAQRTAADIVTSTLSFYVGSTSDRFEHSRRPFLGGDAATGAFINCFGSPNALMRRETFDRIGGFTDVAVGTLDDWEIFSKAALMGYTIETIPEVLVGYREDVDAESMVHSLVNAVRSVRPYTTLNGKISPAVSRSLSKAILFSQGLKFERDAMLGSPLSRGEQGPAVTG